MELQQDMMSQKKYNQCIRSRRFLMHGILFLVFRLYLRTCF